MVSAVKKYPMEISTCTCRHKSVYLSDHFPERGARGAFADYHIKLLYLVSIALGGADDGANHFPQFLAIFNN